MKTTLIPNSDLRVSPVCFGTMNFGTPVREQSAAELIHYGLEKGINFIDTANMYEGYTRFAGSHGGLSEKFIGRAIKGMRANFVIATKFGMKVGAQPEDEGCSPAALAKQLDRSLSYLETDYIDIYYAHKFDGGVAPEELAGAMKRAMDAGKIRYYAVSNYTGTQLRALLAAADANSLPRPILCQPPLSLLKQDALNDVMAVCREENIGVVPYQVLQGGLLTGKYKPDAIAPEGSRAAESEWVWERNEELFSRLRDIEKDADAQGLSMTQYALRWAASRVGVCSVLVGIKTTAHIDEACAALG